MESDLPFEVLAAAFDAAPLAMAVLDESGLVVRANTALAAAAGDEAVAIVGRELFGTGELLDDAGAELVRRLRSGAVDTALVHGRLTAADGSVERVTLGVRALDETHLLAYVEDASRTGVGQAGGVQVGVGQVGGVQVGGVHVDTQGRLERAAVLSDTLGMLLADRDIDGVAVIAIDGLDHLGSRAVAGVLRPGDGAAQYDERTCVVVAVAEDRASAERLRQRVVDTVGARGDGGAEVRVGLVWTPTGRAGVDAEMLIAAAQENARA